MVKETGQLGRQRPTGAAAAHLHQHTILRSIMNEQHEFTPAEMYEHYFGPAIFYPWSGVLLKHAAPRSGEHVLDVACGTGIVTRQAAPLVGNQGRLVGLDINPDMLAVARSKAAPGGPPIEWHEGNAVEHHLPSSAFDLVVCQQGVQFFADRVAAAREMRRVLKPGGRVALAVWQGIEHHPLYASLFEAEARHLGVTVADVATPFLLGSSSEVQAILEAAGFTHIRIVPETLTVRFPEPERFIELTMLAGAAVLPEFDVKDQAARAALFTAVRREAGPVAQRYRNGDCLRVPMSAHIALAYAAGPMR
jgi:ubiquinone/menaquinone biosynthesis C-methylase UbiE